MIASGFTRLPTLDGVQRYVLSALLSEGFETSPRGQSTRELLAFGFELSEPRARTITNKARGWSAALAVGEFAWHMSGSDEVDPIAHYAPIWRSFSDDGSHIRGSCYGRRIFRPERSGASQWTRLVNLLRSDPYTRRALLSVQQDAEDALDPASNDVPCITTCQFLIRNGALNAIVHMRSNDAIWGLPYDVFLFTMLQEMLALELSVKLGSYFHMAGSMHLYDRHLKLAEGILNTPDGAADIMMPMDDLRELPAFLTAERELRTIGSSRVPLSPYWSRLSEPLRRHAKKRTSTKALTAA